MIYIKMNLVLNNLQRLICNKNQPTNQLTNQKYFSIITKLLSVIIITQQVLTPANLPPKIPIYFHKKN